MSGRSSMRRPALYPPPRSGNCCPTPTEVTPGSSRSARSSSSSVFSLLARSSVPSTTTSTTATPSTAPPPPPPAHTRHAIHPHARLDRVHVGDAASEHRRTRGDHHRERHLRDD